MVTSSNLDFEFGTLAPHRERLRVFVMALVRDESTADDTLQDVWIRALDHAPREPLALAGWLRTVAQRVVRNHLRTGSRRAARERMAAPNEAVASAAELAQRAELRRRVLDVLEALAEPHRSLLRDHYFLGLTIPALARRAGLNHHTLKDRLRRARAVMRRALERAGLDEHSATSWALCIAPLYQPGTLFVVLSFVMKKLIALALGLVLAAALLLWSANGPADLQSEDPAHTLARDSTDLSSPAVSPVAAPSTDARSPAAVTFTTTTDDDLSAAPELGWSVRGRVVFSDGATGALPLVRLQLAAFDGYEFVGAPFASAEVQSTEDGDITWPLADPMRTVSIRATLLDVPGYDARCSEHHLAVRGEGPIESIRVYVNPQDAHVEGVVSASSDAASPGAPIAGARVVYNGSQTTTDSRGEYRLPVTSRGYGSVIVTAPGFHRGGATPGGLSASTTTRVDVVLEPALGPEGTVFGYVRDSRGAVLPGARVRCDSSREEAVIADTTGYYELHDIRLHADGNIVVVATASGFAAEERYVRGPADGTLRAEGTQLDFSLGRGSRVTGIVVDIEGRPVRGASVWMGPHSDLVANRRARSNDNGAFVFEHAPPGKTLLGVEKVGLPGHVQDLTVPKDGEPLHVSIPLARPVPLIGRVVDMGGEPVQRATVVATRGEYGRSIRSSARTGPDGGFIITGVPEGDVEVAVKLVGMLPNSTTHVHDGATLELVVERAGRINGRVIDAATRRPLEIFVVRLAPTEDPALGPWFRGIDAAWLFGGRSFSAVDGAWSSDSKDPIRRGAWTYVEVEADGYMPLRLGPLQVPLGQQPTEWLHELVPK